MRKSDKSNSRCCLHWGSPYDLEIACLMIHRVQSDFSTMWRNWIHQAVTAHLGIDEWPCYMFCSWGVCMLFFGCLIPKLFFPEESPSSCLLALMEDFRDLFRCTQQDQHSHCGSNACLSTGQWCFQPLVISHNKDKSAILRIHLPVMVIFHQYPQIWPTVQATRGYW